MTVSTLPAGKALPIAAARLQIAGQDQTVQVSAADKTAVFRVRLKGRRKTQLRAWFQDAAGQDLCGAYYAYVRRL
jgi:hypothetical protein